MEEEKKTSVTEELKKISEAVGVGNTNGKTKKLRFPTRAKVKRGRLKKGWIGIMKIGENQNASFEKVQVGGGSFKTSDGIYHATDGREILFYQGKFPFIVQEEKSKNPYNFNTKENEVYGQKFIMAKMLADTIKVKKGGNMSPFIVIALILVIGYVIGKYVFKVF